jgi:hypothetical protein
MSFKPDRRSFLRNSICWVVAPALAKRGSAAALVTAENASDIQPEALERAFLEPPDSVRPWVFWIACDGNLTREGITADLEAMHRVGVRGVVYYEVDLFVPKGPVRFLTPQWRELFQHAIKEATRLGITIGVNNDGGYSGSGGPWITPELSMQMVVLSETAVEGPRRFSEALLQPKIIANYYRDIAVLAFPAPAGDQVRMATASPSLTYGTARKSFDSAALVSGDPAAVTLVPRPDAGQSQYLNLDFSQPFTAQSITIGLAPWNTELSAAVEVSEDGQHYRQVRQFTLRWPQSSVNFPKASSRHYRLVLTLPDEEFNWLSRPFSKGFPLGKVELHSSPRMEDIPGKAAYIRQETFAGEPAIPAEMAVAREQIVDLSSRLDSQGRLNWDVPSGEWTVLRIGCTSTGKTNHPAPAESIGLECDKLSKKAIEVHFDGMMGKLVQDQAAVAGKALQMTHVDSWEVGSQNWTPDFRQEFERRRGYDLLQWLPVLSGRAVENQNASERFLWDLRRTVGDLLLENYADRLREISHEHGLTLSIEGYGSGPYEDTAYGARADMPMCELWTGIPQWQDLLLGWSKSMASSAHVYGHPLLGMEIFTAEPENGRWQNDLFRLKPIADQVFTLGVNHVDCHRYAMQPWLDRKPGMTMGPFGVHYERTNTWWEQSGPWHLYLARCQALLQSGQFIADVAYLNSENVPQSSPKRDNLEPAIPSGYDFDIVPPEALLKLATVRDGRLTFPSGMSYRVLVLPPSRTMTPSLLTKIRDLVSAGATVVGPRPTASPSLNGYPQCDAEVARLAAELWSECDGVSVTENAVGQGRIVWGKPLATVLTELGASPDFACHDPSVGEHIRYIHRRAGGTDLYFVANSIPEVTRFLATFRTKGKRPEFWWPEDGRTEPVAVYDERNGATFIPLTLGPCGSVFVVFRENPAPLPDRVMSVRRNGVEISGVSTVLVPEIQLRQEQESARVQCAGASGFQIEVAAPGLYELRTATGRLLRTQPSAPPNPVEITGPWELQFPGGWKAPARVRLERLISWTDHADPGVKYFSGKATYRRRFEMPAELLRPERRFYLNLGRVCVLAQASLNGYDLGILWKPPFRVNITGSIREGTNDLVVSVTNLWPNRLIGDEQLPDDCEWAPPNTARNLTPHTWGPVLDHWPQWLLEHKPSPTGRVTFTTWKHWTKDDPLLESGLLGPVRIETREVTTPK